MSPSLRVALALAVSTALAVTLAAALIFGALDRLRAAAEEANTDFVLTQLRQSVEASVSLGLPLPDIRVTQDLIERARATNPEIVAIEVFSADGVSLFNTDRGALGEAISDSWQEAIARVDARWRVEELGALVVGEPILNDFGEAVGGVAVTTSLRERTDHAYDIQVTLVPATITAALIAGFVVGGVSYRALRWAGRDFQAAASVLGDATLEPKTAANTAATAAQGVRAHIDQRAADIRALAVQVSRLDDADGWGAPADGEATTGAQSDPLQQRASVNAL